MDKSYFIITDSGGVQEEAPSLGKPVLVMRDTTEAGTNKESIINEGQKLLDNQNEYNTMGMVIL